MSNQVATKIQNRIEEQKEAIEAFVRLHRELTEMREALHLPEAQQRVEALLSINAESLGSIRDELATSIALLRGTPARPACAVVVD